MQEIKRERVATKESKEFDGKAMFGELKACDKLFNSEENRWSIKRIGWFVEAAPEAIDDARLISIYAGPNNCGE